MSPTKASYRSVETLRDWFFQMKMPFWTLWNGFSKETKDKAAFNTVTNDMEESWSILEQMLVSKLSSGGRVTIFVRNEKETSNGATEYLEIPSPNFPQLGIGAPTMGAAMGGGNINAYIDEKVSSMMDKFHLERKVEDLEARLNEKQEGSGINKFFNRIIEEIPIENLVMAFASKIMGGNISPNIQPAINGTEQVEMSQEQAHVIEEAIYKLSQVFEDVPSVMIALANWVETNPAMAKTFFSQLK